MKSTIQRVLFAVAVATFGAGAVGTASAQTTSSAPGATPEHRMHGHHHHFGGPLVGPLLQATKQLGLTAQQQSVIQGYLKAAHQPHQAAAQPQGPGMTVLADPGNQNYATAVTALQSAASARIAKEQQLAESIYNELNSVQKTQLPTVLASIQAKEQARRAAWAAKHTTSNG
jgi:hypothetical protein